MDFRLRINLIGNGRDRSELLKLADEADSLLEELVGKYQTAVENAQEEKTRAQKTIAKAENAIASLERHVSGFLAPMEGLRRGWEGTRTITFEDDRGVPVEFAFRSAAFVPWSMVCASYWFEYDDLKVRLCKLRLADHFN